MGGPGLDFETWVLWSDRLTRETQVSKIETRATHLKTEEPETMFLKTAPRWFPASLLLLALTLCLLRFAWLDADFPNHSPWMLDQAKYTDEGWWANGAVRHFLLGHWEVPGDYNPAVAVPVWPALLTLIFHFTGVSLLAARAMNVAFSVATVALIYRLIRRNGGEEDVAALAALLLAASPFAFVFSRLATLDTLVVFEWTLLLWLASYAGRGRLWILPLLGALVAATVLTKTTVLVLLPSVLWVLWRKNPRALLAVSALGGALLGLYLLLVLRTKYADDYHYFFAINAMADVDLKSTGGFLLQLFQHSVWIDRVLYPAGLACLVLSLAWLRPLWRNPLFAASWIAFAGSAVFILRRQDDYAPRYFLPMLAPLILALVLTLQELRTRNRILAGLLAIVVTIAVVLNTMQIAGFLAHRQYQFLSAAKSIQAMVKAHPDAHPLLLGSSGDQLSLMTGIPAINDEYSSEVLGQKVSLYQPGWYVGWNDLDDDIVGDLSAFRLDEVASYPVFDHDDRNRLKLYRLVPVKGEHK
jgi:hypothetical protein